MYTRHNLFYTINVTAKLYINNVLIETKTVTSSYSYIYEAPEGKTHSYKLQVINSVGSNEKTNSTWIGTILLCIYFIYEGNN